MRRLLDVVQHLHASLGNDVSDDKAQVEIDVNELAVSMLTNQVRMVRLDEKIHEMCVEAKSCIFFQGHLY